MDLAGTEQNEGSDNPGPEELPENRWPPLPASALLDSLLHGGASYFSARDTEIAVELAGHEEHEDCEEELRL